VELIFDDASSALDLKTEADLYAALRQYRPDSTKIIVGTEVGFRVRDEPDCRP
jgi:ATP-binding cassette subfamily B protein